MYHFLVFLLCFEMQLYLSAPTIKDTNNGISIKRQRSDFFGF